MYPLWEQGLDETLKAGKHNNFSFAIESITVGSGDAVQLPRAGVVAVVGGNNVGKSTLLRQIYEHLSHGPGQPRVAIPPVLTDLTMERSAPAADLIAWLGEHSIFALGAQGQSGSFHRAGVGAITAADANTYWSGAFGIDRLGALASFLVSHANARDRFQWVQPVGRRGNFTDPPTHPVHALEDRKLLLDELSKLSIDIFGRPLTLDRISGNIQLRVGQTNSTPPPIDSVTEEYLQELSELNVVGMDVADAGLK